MTPVAPRWHVATTACAPSAQGSVHDPLFFPHYLEFSANLAQKILTSIGSGRQEVFFTIWRTVNFDFDEAEQRESAQYEIESFGG